MNAPNGQVCVLVILAYDKADHCAFGDAAVRHGHTDAQQFARFYPFFDMRQFHQSRNLIMVFGWSVSASERLDRGFGYGGLDRAPVTR